jgi:bacterial/archaeal transporter family protein
MSPGAPCGATKARGAETRAAVVAGADLWLAKAAIPCRSKHAVISRSDLFQPLGSISGRTYLFLVLSGLATGGILDLHFRALKLGNASQVAPIDKLSVVLVAVFGVIFLGENLSVPNWLGGILLIAGGAYLVAFR